MGSGVGVEALQATLDTIQRSFAEAFGQELVSVLLFGSRARGDARDGSDWDILLIAEDLPDRTLDRHVFVKKLLPSAVRSTVSIIAVTRSEFDAIPYLPSLYLDIALDGRIISDRGDYASRRLAAIRDLMDAVGLSREHTPAGDVWRFEDGRVTALPVPWLEADHAARRIMPLDES